MLGINADRRGRARVRDRLRARRPRGRLRGAHLLAEPGHGARAHPDVVPHHHRGRPRAASPAPCSPGCSSACSSPSARVLFGRGGGVRARLRRDDRRAGLPPRRAARQGVKRGLLGLLIAALALLPPLGEPYVLHVAIVVLIHVVYAQALYVIMRMGYLSFGHAGYIALGGYTSALLATKLDVSARGSASSRAALVAAALRVGARHGHAEAARHLLQPVGVRLRRGRERRLPRLRRLRRPRRHRRRAAAGVLRHAAQHATCSSTTSSSSSRWCRSFFLYRLQWTRFGFTLLALRTRDTEALAESIGIDAARHKTLAFVVSCFFCGLMGAVHVPLPALRQPLRLHVLPLHGPDGLRHGRRARQLLGADARHRAAHRARRAALRRGLLQEPRLRGRAARRHPRAARRAHLAAARLPRAAGASARLPAAARRPSTRER